MTLRNSCILGSLSVTIAILGLLFGPRFGAFAAPVIGSGPISLSELNDTQVLYTSATSPADRIAVAVTVTAGSAEVEQQDASGWVSLGSVPAGTACVFEGAYLSVRVKANQPATVGLYSSRGPTDNSLNPDHVVGSGSLTLGASPIRIYAAGTASSRSVFITAGPIEVGLRTTSSGTNVLTVPPGQTAAFQGQNAEYWLAGTGAAHFAFLDSPSAGTWMQLPQVNWKDAFSPLWFNTSGVFAVGDPTREEDEEVILTRNIVDSTEEEPGTIDYIDNEALINFYPDVTAGTIETLLDSLGLDIRHAYFRPDPDHPIKSMSYFHVRIRPTSEYFGDVPGLIQYLEALSTVDFAEYNDLFDVGAWPNGTQDPSFINQVELVRLGTYSRDSSNNPVNDGAWATETGNGTCVVVMDTGVDAGHSDLVNMVYKHTTPSDTVSRPLGIAATDGNTPIIGRTDGNIALSTAATNKPNHGHGTIVAGVVCAESYNGNIVSGCGPDLRYMSARLKQSASGKLPKGSVVVAINALHDFFSVNDYPEIRVVNMSFFGRQSQKEKDPLKNSIGTAILNDLAENDRLYVACAPESFDPNTPGKEARAYPAAWSFVLGVTGAANTTYPLADTSGQDFRKQDSGFWCGGTTGLEPDRSVYGVSAYFDLPVGLDYTDSPPSIYGYFAGDVSANRRGTSFAAPQVAALAGLLYGKAKRNNMSGVTYQVIDSHIKSHVKDPYLEFNHTTKAHGKTTTMKKRLPGVVDFKSAVESF